MKLLIYTKNACLMWLRVLWLIWSPNKQFRRFFTYCNIGRRVWKKRQVGHTQELVFTSLRKNWRKTNYLSNWTWWDWKGPNLNQIKSNFSLKSWLKPFILSNLKLTSHHWKKIMSPSLSTASVWTSILSKRKTILMLPLNSLKQLILSNYKTSFTQTLTRIGIILSKCIQLNKKTPKKKSHKKVIKTVKRNS